MKNLFKWFPCHHVLWWVSLPKLQNLYLFFGQSVWHAVYMKTLIHLRKESLTEEGESNLSSQPIPILEFCELFHMMEPRHAAYWNFLYSFIPCKSLNPERWSLYYNFITCLLQEKQGYPESRSIVKYGVSFVYGKSWEWSSIKMQYHNHQFESILTIPNCNTLRSSIKMQHNDHQSLITHKKIQNFIINNQCFVFFIFVMCHWWQS